MTDKIDKIKILNPEHRLFVEFDILYGANPIELDLDQMSPYDITLNNVKFKTYTIAISYDEFKKFIKLISFDEPNIAILINHSPIMDINPEFNKVTETNLDFKVNSIHFSDYVNIKLDIIKVRSHSSI